MAQRAEMSGELIGEEEFTMEKLDRPTRKQEERSTGAAATRGLRALVRAPAIPSVAEPWVSPRWKDPSTQAEMVDVIKGDINGHKGIIVVILVGVTVGVIGQTDSVDQKGLTALHWTRYGGSNLAPMFRSPARKRDVDTVWGTPGERPM